MRWSIKCKTLEKYDYSKIVFKYSIRVNVLSYIPELLSAQQLQSCVSDHTGSCQLQSCFTKNHFDRAHS